MQKLQETNGHDRLVFAEHTNAIVPLGLCVASNLQQKSTCICYQLGERLFVEKARS